MAKYSLEEAFEELKKRSRWEPNTDTDTVDKLLRKLFKKRQERTLLPEDEYLMRLFGDIINE